MPLSSSNNAVLADTCKNLQNLTLTLHVTLDMITDGNNGFSLQLNCYPQTKPQAAYNGHALNWFQYVIAVDDDEVTWGIQYWSEEKGFGFSPPDNYSKFATAASNQVVAGSVMRIALKTDSNDNVTSATFSITDPTGKASTYTYPLPSDCWCAIYGFQADIVGPPTGTHNCSFTSGLGILTYFVTTGTLSVQTTNTCGGSQIGTGETSNVLYGDLVPPSGQELFQLFVG